MLGKLPERTEVFYIRTDVTVEMRENNNNHPYRFIKVPATPMLRARREISPHSRPGSLISNVFVPIYLALPRSIIICHDLPRSASIYLDLPLSTSIYHHLP